MPPIELHSAEFWCLADMEDVIRSELTPESIMGRRWSWRLAHDITLAVWQVLKACNISNPLYP